ncbi:DUF1801 domain-containing protein [Pseudooceanicola nitratireducens]|jgi:uncharacterized protein YdhG (YjbR/CyaY superfamily)|uniref:YdhG-like domain-containing protein n=1 Tax=Pseudooceanicola nitratireducens TaxID=517719 RepID=A0A1I1MLI6_9RHOB|nr:DUF1801 domain-containing protein [Pseudooceanicola nitratireducens]MBY6156765.1 DUF1801 domain-containing protein [Pseudooceanicola nitratireducens]MBY6166428.1 DUF1801 domain-containing protein [Pseudooceanicola nitratireducens]SEI84515.1 hypothetical protein SAMN05216183_101860 [Pseudooceanicola nitratireducens]SFC86231.1 hypothetical protein SAMN05421762_2480 [Pseudooceanicola nitratireducens]
MSDDAASYIAAHPAASAKALKTLRTFLAGRIAHAGVAVEEVMSYSMPGYRILSGRGTGKMLMGYAAWKDHLAVYPHSGTVLPQMLKLTRGISQTKSALHVPIGSLPPEAVIDQMIHLRLEELH